MLRMIVTDLDGTLLNRDGIVTQPNLETLELLSHLGIVRTIATGRSPYSIDRVIPDNFPVDYIVFSSGAGIIRWHDKQIIHKRHLSQHDTQTVINEFQALGVDFMIHEPIPHNHCFLYHSVTVNNPDFFRRIDIYNAYCRPYIPGVEFPNGATQLIAILPNNPDLFFILEEKFPDLKVIRTTSPLDGNSIWMEIFPKDVSKAYGVNWLCSHEVHCNISEVVSIGNDYNDLDMLNLTNISYVVANAPNELKDCFRVVPSNDEFGFSVAVKDALSILQ